MIGKETVLVVSVHPDDETLGCAGSILKHRSRGHKVYWLVLTCAYAPKFNDAYIRNQTLTLDKIKRFYGFSGACTLNYPTTQLDIVPKATLVEKIADYCRTIKPTTLYVNNPHDVHSDHRAGFACVMAATKPMRAVSSLKKIYAYETLSETEQMPPLRKYAFVPNYYVDISKFMSKKIQALAIYRNELQPFPLPREKSAVLALARFRGTSVAVGYAEAFILIRELA